MECSKLGYKIWVIAIYLMTSLKGVSSMKLHRDLGITQKSAWHLAHRLRTAFESDGFDPPFIGPVEADETYMGGKEKNKHAKSQRSSSWSWCRGQIRRCWHQGSRHSRGARGGERRQDHVQGFVNCRRCDALHGRGQRFRMCKAHTNGIESFWALLKRGFIGIYHKMSPKHLQRYVNEFAGPRVPFADEGVCLHMEGI